MSQVTPETEANAYPWINPVGGLGDALMISGVLKLAYDRDPRRKYNLVKRTKYLDFLKDHPAITGAGYPPKDADLRRTDYWSMEELGPGEKRPFQVLARAYGLETPVEEILYMPGKLEADPVLHERIPWRGLNVAIAPSSDSPRKCMPPEIWHRVTDLLLADDALVMQVGRLNDLHIRNSYSVLGLTTPRQLFSLIKRCDLVMTSDNFIMHAAHMTGTPTVAIWGATHHKIYGYPEQVHVQMPKSCDLGPYDDCIGPRRNQGGKTYGSPCPLGPRQCLARARPEAIYEAAQTALYRS